ncbi:hypothetical protein [Psychroserpens sp.]|uniref:DUF7738 domain-containing protein n=1 Tax=Psychroserpens sp. TaxID=2020870 RepID=UPI003858A5FA
MKKSIVLLITIFSINIGLAQKDVEIIYSHEKEVFLNEQKLDKDTNLETIKSILGEPVIYKEHVTGKVNYHYPDLGISIHFVNNNLLFIGANFNWDGDKNFPETTFTGKFEIDNVKFDKDSKNAILSDIKIVDIKCIMPEICMTNPKKEKDIIIVGFKDGNLTQVGIEFH